MSNSAPGTVIGPVGRSRLITSLGDPLTPSANQETDARTAILRGLADYLEGLVVQGSGGREIRLRRVATTWAEPEEHALYPSAILSTPSAGVYDASKFSPTPNPRCRLPSPDGRYLVSHAEFAVDVYAEIWCTDPRERSDLIRGLEVALLPVPFMYGFILELPHYFNQRAIYELKSVQYLDTEVEAVQRYRRAVFVLTAQLPLVQLVTLPEARRPKLRLDVTDPSVIVTVNGSMLGD